MLHDTNKRLIKVSDIYPDFADLKKGEYIIRLQLRHDNAVLLDKMKNLLVIVEQKLKEPVSVPVYVTNRDAVKGGKPNVKERSLHIGRLWCCSSFSILLFMDCAVVQSACHTNKRDAVKGGKADVEKRPLHVGELCWGSSSSHHSTFWYVQHMTSPKQNHSREYNVKDLLPCEAKDRL